MKRNDAQRNETDVQGGQAAPGDALRLEHLPELEVVCKECRGEGGSKWAGEWSECSFCDGAGYIPTEFGQKVLALVRHNLRLDAAPLLKWR
jgi:hypothetical protein